MLRNCPDHDIIKAKRYVGRVTCKHYATFRYITWNFSPDGIGWLFVKATLRANAFFKTWFYCLATQLTTKSREIKIIFRDHMFFTWLSN